MENQNKLKKIERMKQISKKSLKSVEETKHAGGRPPFYNSAEELQTKIDEYFLYAPNKRKIIFNGQVTEIPVFTISGLAYYLGFSSRQSFYEYKEKPEFVDIIKRASLFIENEYEILLQGSNVAGPIFALKNMGWKDKTEVEQTNIIPVESKAIHDKIKEKVLED
jgi:hypothetical protein